MEVINWITENATNIVTALVALLHFVIAICLLIPGEQPEKSLQKIVDFLSKFSKKRVD